MFERSKGITVFLIIMVLAIVAIIVVDWYSKRPDNMPANQFEFSVADFKNVPEELILYREVRNFKLGLQKPSGLTIFDDVIYIVGDRQLCSIDTTGKLLKKKSLKAAPRTIDVVDGKIFVAFERGIEVFNQDFEMKGSWQLPDSSSYITALASTLNEVFVADAGKRKVLRFSHAGRKLNVFEGKSSEDVLHGFIIPSPYFDMDLNEYGELWVVNPGMHRLENYTPQGKMRAYWEASGAATENFSGCCNPAYFCFDPDGNFITSEKGLVRVKIYKPSGEFMGVVAPPTKFNDGYEGHAPDVASDSRGNIYLLDFDRNLLRMFQRK